MHYLCRTRTSSRSGSLQYLFSPQTISRRSRSCNYSTTAGNTEEIKIKSIKAYQVNLPLKEGSYNWSGGKSVQVFDSTVIEIITNQKGISGYGEVCPLGPFYLPSYAKGVRVGLAELGPHLLNQDPTKLGSLNHLMDKVLKGHPYVKSGVDMACWDILGKVCSQPVHKLLGGSHMDSIPLYRAISQESPEGMAAKVAGYKEEGYTKFQLKVGGDVETDIARIKAVRKVLDSTDILVADANTGWLPHQAQRVIRGVSDVDVYIEQPCDTLEQCLLVRQNSTHPFILDEVINDLHSLLAAHGTKAMDGINIKISKFGGLTNAKLARDLAVSLGLTMIIEDSWGGDIITAAIAHLAQSTPERNLFAATDFNSYGTITLAEGAPKRIKGRMSASNKPGLGVFPLVSVLGNPVLEIN